VAKAIPLRDVLAAGAKTARLNLGLRQEDAATRVRKLGLTSWIRGTVAQVEVGARRLTLEEFVVLALAYETTPAALVVGADDELVELTPDARVTVAQLRALWSGQGAAVQPVPSGRRSVAETARARLRAGRDGVAEPSEADRRAARRLGLSLEEALAAAMKRWGRTLSDERDRRLAEQAAELSPRQLQALRGHITRDLLTELTTDLPEASAKTTARTRTAGARGRAR